MQIPDILNSIDPTLLDTDFSSVSDRYYEHKYCLQLASKPIHQRVSFHSNRICLISLAPSHPIIERNKPVLRVNFSVSDKVDRSKNAASGKGKRGAQKLVPESVLCYVECEGDEVYPVYGCVRGKLVEVNEGLVKNPQLLVERPKAEGFIALVLPIFKSYDEVKGAMLSEEEYLNTNSVSAHSLNIPSSKYDVNK